MATQSKTLRYASGVLLAALLGIHPATAQTVEYYHLDALGSVRAITNQSGAIVVRHDYLPFGEEWNPPLSSDRRMFTGKERDSETGFDYFGARYLAARLGRFTTVDPELTLPQSLADPQRWNRYAYVRNNPVRYTDPDGKAIDTLLDIGFLVYDVFDIARSLIRREGVSGTQIQALGADAVATVIPFATGAGLAVRAAGRAEKALGAAKRAEQVVDFSTKATREWSAWYRTEGEVRALARTKLGSNPVAVSPGKLRSPDGRWQYRANPKDLANKHIHLEQLNPKTGEVIQNVHLRWTDKIPK